MSSKEHSLQEIAFLDFLFDGETIRHPEEAKRLAGYPKDYPVVKIIKNLNKELIDRCDSYLAMYAPVGVMGLMQLIHEPETPGSKLKLQALIELMDRAGVVKKEKTEVAHVSQSFMFVVPPKLQIKEE